jgi:hypothetical protein
MYTSENNWYQWQYGNDTIFGRQTDNKKLKTIYNRMDRPLLSFKEELIEAAKSSLDHYPGLRPCVFFSGGVDSELMLRTYIDIGANPKVYIIRYENDYNIYDVSYAVTICSLLNVDYTIIDFNLKKFYENDAEKISELAQIDRPRALPYCKFIEMIDGLPILGEGDPYWVRLNDDYSMPGQWRFRELETFIGWNKYALYLNKPSVVQFFKWTPGLILSHTNLIWLKKLITDQYIGKTGTNSTKILGYREVYPDLLNRKKQSGFEKIDSMVNDFEMCLQQKYKGLLYRQTVDKTLDGLWTSISYSTHQSSKDS